MFLTNAPMNPQTCPSVRIGKDVCSVIRGACWRSARSFCFCLPSCRQTVYRLGPRRRNNHLYGKSAQTYRQQSPARKSNPPHQSMWVRISMWRTLRGINWDWFTSYLQAPLPVILTLILTFFFFFIKPLAQIFLFIAVNLFE